MSETAPLELLELALGATIKTGEALDAGDVEEARGLVYAAEDDLYELRRLLQGDAVQPDPGGELLAGRDWLQAALQLDGENRQLRDWLTRMLFWVAEHEELLDFARAGIEARFPGEKGRRAA